MNSYLLKMLDSIVSYVESHSSGPIEEVLMQSLMMVSAQDTKDAPTPPKGTPSYAMMMAQLVDTVKKEVDDEDKAGSTEAMLAKLKDHREKLHEQTLTTGKKLADLETEDKAKITSDDLHEGFSAGHINKEKPAPAPAKKKTVTQKVQAVEQLNAGSVSATPGEQSLSSGAEADVEEEAEGDEEEGEQHIEPTELGKAFAKIKIGEYRKCMQFISDNPAVVAEKETDGLLIEAFNSQISGKDDYARQCVHQALLLQYCRQLGRDGVSLFFKRYNPIY